jgi:hypothetical protein
MALEFLQDLDRLIARPSIDHDMFNIGQSCQQPIEAPNRVDALLKQTVITVTVNGLDLASTQSIAQPAAYTARHIRYLAIGQRQQQRRKR